MTERTRVFRGDRLRSLRSNRGLTQVQMAEKLGVGDTQYGRYETKNSDPSLDVLVRIIDVLDVNPEYLLGTSDIPYRHPVGLSPEEQKAIEAFRARDTNELMRIMIAVTDQERKKER